MMAHPTSQQGFSLIEAIVSLVLIATVGMAVFVWINAELSSLRKITDLQQQAEAIRNTLSFIKTVNPMTTPEGNYQFGEFHLAWNSETLSKPKPGTGYPRGISLYDVGFYKMNVTVSLENTEIASYTVHKTGYKQVRFLQLDTED
ncbi:MAG: PulJ/GspJ family protein [Gammaproteobacteria bacterium]